MHDRTKRHTLLAVLLTAAPMGLVGCETLNTMTGGSEASEKTVDPDRYADVVLKDPVYGGEVTVRVVADYRNMEDAIGLLRTRDWARAEQAFAEIAEKSKGNDDQFATAHYARGVAQEAQGDYSAALESYKVAFSKKNDSDFEDAMNRAREAVENQ